MTDPTIICPHCKGQVHLTEAMAAPLLASAHDDFKRQMAKKEAELQSTREAIDQEVASKLEASRKQIAEEEAARARKVAAAEIEQGAKKVTDLEALLADRSNKLSEAQKAQADLLKKTRDLEEAQGRMELTIEQRVQASVETVREQAKVTAEQSLGLKLAEKDEQIGSMRRQIEDLKRKAEQGSQQLQGEVQELQLENMLRGRFPTDQIEPVPKGEYGGDVLQRVVGPFGDTCGSILWETKRTKNWSDGWLAKLRGDM